MSILAVGWALQRRGEVGWLWRRHGPRL